MRIALISTYDLGRQPFGLASPAAWLRRAGADVRCLDLSRVALDPDVIARAALVAVHLPMHTATRLAVPVLQRIRAINPSARLVAYGLYAPPNADYLRSVGADLILGPEAEADLVRLACGEPGGAPPVSGRLLPRLQFVTPDRSGLPPLASYATLQLPDGSRRHVGYTEASRGCRHRCRHCPVVPVYDGQFRVVQPEVVLADIRAQVAAGARHITFGDPDFLNGPTHALRIVEALAREWPGLTYDVVIKIEHILRYPDALRRLQATGCLFVTSAVESFDATVLARLDKGHSPADVERAAEWLRGIGLPLVPTFVAFTPWTTAESYLEMLATIDRLELVEHVAPIQLSIRLLIPAGSRLLELGELRPLIESFDPHLLAHRWRHPDARVDRLQEEVAAVVGRRLSAPRREAFDAVRTAVREAAGLPPAVGGVACPRLARAAVPYLNEPWYC